MKLTWEEDRVLKRLATEVSQRQTQLAKLSMEIRGLRVPLVEPQPPLVSHWAQLCIFAVDSVVSNQIGVVGVQQSHDQALACQRPVPAVNIGKSYS